METRPKITNQVGEGSSELRRGDPNLHPYRGPTWGEVPRTVEGVPYVEPDRVRDVKERLS